jgi:hypothetical protein
MSGRRGKNWLELADNAVVQPAMEHDRLYDEASKVEAEDGEVLVDGPDGVAVSLTPDAAAETSDRLLDGAMTARGQQVAEEAHRKAPTGRSS